MSTCDAFNCLFPLDVPNEIQLLSSLLFMASLFIGFLVERCVTCQKSRNSDFGWHRFRFSPCLMRIKRGFKILKRFSRYLIAFRSCISNGKLDCKTVGILAYSSKRGHSNERSGTRLKTESETGERR